MISLGWHGCYGKNWKKGEITPESFAHPAKFSRKLIRRIYGFLLEAGLLKADDTVLDPFGGVALGAADALKHGINWIGVELEQRFVDTGAGCDCEGISKGDWIRFYGRWDKVNHKGGRYWCPRCVAEAGKVTEPLPQPSLFEMENRSASYVRDSGRIPSTQPHRYVGNLDLFAQTAKDGARAVLLQGDSRRLADVLGETEGNLGNLTARGEDSKAIITSPPFAGTSGGLGEASRNAIGSALFDRHRGSVVGGIGDEADGNMASMQAKETDLRAIVASPPYGSNQKNDHTCAQRDSQPQGKGCFRGSYGHTEGQLTKMGGQAIITSPPYASSLASDEAQKRGGLFRDPKRAGDQTLTATYGETVGQLGLDSGGTFWGAAKLIVSQCRQGLAADGVAVFITKNFVKGGQRVPLTDQWVKLCEACGFELIVHARAWLIEDRQGQQDFNGAVVTKRVQHKSFFRLLAEKNGSPSIDWEDVLIFRIAKNYKLIERIEDEDNDNQRTIIRGRSE